MEEGRVGGREAGREGGREAGREGGREECLVSTICACTTIYGKRSVNESVNYSSHMVLSSKQRY